MLIPSVSGSVLYIILYMICQQTWKLFCMVDSIIIIKKKKVNHLIINLPYMGKIESIMGKWSKTKSCCNLTARQGFVTVFFFFWVLPQPLQPQFISPAGRRSKRMLSAGWIRCGVSISRCQCRTEPFRALRACLMVLLQPGCPFNLYTHNHIYDPRVSMLSTFLWSIHKHITVVY